MIIVLVPIVVAVVGALVWAVTPPTYPILKDMGRIAFVIGLFWAVAPYARTIVPPLLGR